MKKGIVTGWLMAVAMLFSISVANADDISWSGTTGDWTTGGNWGGTVPGVGDIARVNNSGTAQLSAAVTVDKLYLGNSGGHVGTVEVSSGSLDVTVSDGFYIGDAGTGTLNISGGTVTAPDVVRIGRATSGDGTVVMTGGTFESGRLFLSSGGDGLLEVENSSTLTVNGYVNMANGTGTFNVKGSGSTIELHRLVVNGGKGHTLNLSLDAGGISLIDVKNMNAGFGYDRQAILNDLEIVVDEMPGFSASLGDTFDVIKAENGITTNTDFSVTSLIDGLAFSATVVNISGSDTLRLTAVEAADTALVWSDGNGNGNWNEDGNWDNVYGTDYGVPGGNIAHAFITNGTANITPASQPPGAVVRTYVGGTGGAILNVGASANFGRFYIGESSGETGTVNLTSGTLTQTVDQEFHIGVGGIGTINISGGTLQGTDVVRIGKNAGSDGTVDMTGGTFESGRLFIGSGGNGLLEVESNATLTVNGYINMANGPGTFNVKGSGSTIELHRLAVNAGKGHTLNLFMDAGGISVIDVKNMNAGFAYASEALLTDLKIVVDELPGFSGGVGDTFDVIKAEGGITTSTGFSVSSQVYGLDFTAAVVTVGSDQVLRLTAIPGAAMLELVWGGAVDNNWNEAGNWDNVLGVDLGVPGGNDAYALITNGTASITPSSQPPGAVARGYVGGTNGAALNVGADASFGYFILAGADEDSGTVNLTAGTLTQTVNQQFLIGDHGTGTINISGGTLQGTDVVRIGRAAGSDGSVVMTGGTFESGRLFLSSGGDGLLEVANNSTLTVNGYVQMANGTGTFNVKGSESTIELHRLVVNAVKGHSLNLFLDAGGISLIDVKDMSAGFTYDSQALLGDLKIVVDEMPGFSPSLGDTFDVIRAEDGITTLGLTVSSRIFGLDFEPSILTVGSDEVLRLTTVAGDTRLDLWAADYGITDLLDDADGDGLDNLSEFALGGNPTNALDQGHAPASWSAGSSLNYVYPMRSEQYSGVSYQLETTDDLIYGDWAETDLELGTATDGYAAGFDAVTNQMDTSVKNEQFIRLIIEEL